MSYSTAVLASKVVSLQDRASYNVINNNASSGQNYNLSLDTYRKSLMLFPYKSNSHSFTFYSKEISRKNKACMYYRYTNCTNLREPSVLSDNIHKSQMLIELLTYGIFLYTTPQQSLFLN